jgi:hypothetical protein
MRFIINMRVLKSTILTALLVVISVSYGLAQCAMCRATVENNVSNGDTTVGAGLNMGILYLFSAPYVALAAIGYVWYRHAKKKKQMGAIGKRF